MERQDVLKEGQGEKMQTELKVQVEVEVEVEAEDVVGVEQGEAEVPIAEKAMGRIDQREARSSRYWREIQNLEKEEEVEEVVEGEVEAEDLGQPQLQWHGSMTSWSSLSSIWEKGAADITISAGHHLPRNTIGFCHFPGILQDVEPRAVVIPSLHVACHDVWMHENHRGGVTDLPWDLGPYPDRLME
jgi:hypothetical protein